ncbi:MAG: hypothetical protein QNJ90_11055, partial [Planctomycetota bacterium]|nr:hypothetical protein [Planctomycetota bacterium]
MEQATLPPTVEVPMRRLLTALFCSLVSIACGGGGGGGPEAPDPSSLPVLVLSHHITELANVDLVVPSGALSGDEVKAHSHFRTDGSAVPIYAPTDMTLTQGTWVGASNDYGLIFEVNARYRIALG